MKIISEVVKVFDVNEFHAGDGDAFRFRLEISRNLSAELYTARVYRLETYRLQPTFPQTDGVPPQHMNDALIYVLDDVFDSSELNGGSVQEIVDKFHTQLHALFASIIDP